MIHLFLHKDYICDSEQGHRKVLSGGHKCLTELICVAKI